MLKIAEKNVDFVLLDRLVLLITLQVKQALWKDFSRAMIRKASCWPGSGAIAFLHFSHLGE